MVPPFCESQNGTLILEGGQASPTPFNFFCQEDYFTLVFVLKHQIPTLKIFLSCSFSLFLLLYYWCRIYLVCQLGNTV